MQPIRVVVLLLASLQLPACSGEGQTGIAGSGVKRVDSRRLAPFSVIRLYGAGQLEVTVGAPTPLVVETDDNLIDRIETVVTDGTLRIEVLDNVHPRAGLTYRAGVRDLAAVHVSGTGKAWVNGQAGGALVLDVSGAGAIRASGTASRLDTTIAGAGTIDASDLVADDVRVVIAGSGDARVHAEKTLAVSISGIGAVTYSGDAEVVERNVAGVATLKQVP